MLKRNIPIDGVGLQMHYGTPNDKPAADSVKANIQRFADLGLKVLISEMDVNCCDGVTNEEEAGIYHDLIAACVGIPECWAITLWGVGDRNSWLNTFGEANCNGQSARALLWDDDFQKKPAYTAVMQALMGQ
jgi:endo-1,4-beta-xylanase